MSTVSLGYGNGREQMECLVHTMVPAPSPAHNAASLLCSFITGKRDTRVGSARWFLTAVQPHANDFTCISLLLK